MELYHLSAAVQLTQGARAKPPGEETRNAQ